VHVLLYKFPFEATRAAYDVGKSTKQLEIPNKESCYIKLNPAEQPGSVRWSTVHLFIMLSSFQPLRCFSIPFSVLVSEL
jgi:hypothetical protein